MDKNQKILLTILALIMIFILGVAAFNVFMPKPEVKPNDIEVSQRNTEEEEEQVQAPEVKTKEYINIYFIGKNENKEEIYKAVKRSYSKEEDGSKINFAIHSLINGPIPDEIKHGVYTEIPTGTRVIKITELSDRVIVNLNSEYVNGGGADSLYKRLYQLIKTAKLNSALPVYLYIEGQKADVVGGEGIMISQPLSNSSLEN